MALLWDYGITILQGAFVTLQVAILSLLLSTFIGFTCALIKVSSSPLKHLINIYTTVIRGIPELVLMLIVFYGGQIAVNDLGAALGYDAYIDINPFIAGIITIGFIFGAYMTETFRGALLAVDREQISASYAFGFSVMQTTLYVVIPQVIKHGIISFTNNWLVLLKSTALVSIIGLNDIVRQANLASSTTKEPFVFYIAVALFFLLVTFISNIFLKKVAVYYRIDQNIS